jgi:ABC-type multidrug transport system ATPase subunit
VVEDSGKYSNEKHHIIERKNIEGSIYFLNLPSAHLFIFYYQGEEPLFLNNVKIVPGKSYFFNKGNSLSGYKAGLHNVKLEPVYYNEVAEQFLSRRLPHPVELKIDQLGYHYSGSREGIQPFSFSSRSFFLVGIMGSSGTGKSTLLKLLNGSIKPTKGNVWINGYDLHAYKKSLRNLIGYVPQHDLLFESLSIYENLLYSARLCCGRQKGGELHQRVADLLHELGLWHIRNRRVGSHQEGNISGGQRKRLNLSLELIREPAVLLVDEPTSGLSSNDSLQVMNLLRKQTLKGRLVIASIHQPASRIFKLLDQLLVLDEGGRTTYTGDPTEALVYFKTLHEHVNAQEKECSVCGNLPAETILEIMEEREVNPDGERGQHRRMPAHRWYELYKDHLEPPETGPPEEKPLPPLNKYTPGWGLQWKIFTKRNLLSKLRNKQFLLIGLLEAPVLALILAYFTKYTAGIPGDQYAYIFSRNMNLPVYLFMSIIVALFVGLLSSSDDIIGERRIVEREKFLNLSRSGYLLSRLFILAVLSGLQMLMFVLLGNTILEIRGMTLPYFLVLFATAFFANMLGLNLSSGIRSRIAIYVLIPLILIPHLLFSGMVIPFDRFHGRLTPQVYPPVVADVMASRWGFEALSVKQFRDNAYERPLFSVHRLESTYAYRVNHYLPRLIEECRVIRQHMKQSGPHRPVWNDRVRLVRNELEELQKWKPLPTALKEAVTTRARWSESTLQGSVDYLRSVRRSQARKMEQVIYRRDSMIRQMAQRHDLTGRKRNHHNQALAKLVARKNQRQPVIIKDHRLVRNFEPVYQKPSHSFGRAPFFAADKKLGSQWIGTWKFNLAVLWLFIFLLYGLLYFDVLRKLLDALHLQGNGDA